MNMPGKQRGVALIIAMFVFTLAAIAAVAMASRQTFDIRRTENLIHYDQAFTYAMGAEKYAQQAIASDRDPNVDYYGENNGDNFLTKPVAGEVEGGKIIGYIHDAAARFPVNNLVDANGNKNQIYVDAFQRFVNYLTSGDGCGGQGSFNPDLANVLLDWIDKNAQTEVGGAEDGDYLKLEHWPHRAANQWMASITELRELNNVISEEYNCFAGDDKNPPLINTIREPDVAINVNTAPPAVIQSIYSKIDGKILEALTADRDTNPYHDVKSFVAKLEKELAFDDKDPQQKKQHEDFLKQMGLWKLAVNSQFFEAKITIDVGGIGFTMTSLLKRDGKKVTTVQRSIGTL